MSIKSVDMTEQPEPAWARALRRAVEGLRFGSVEVLVHDGRVVQVETREKVRFADDRPADQRQRNLDERRHHRTTGAAAPEETNE
jgi:hypothetical protein